MKVIHVASVDPVSPGDESASVTLDSGKGQLVAFCWPCGLHVGDEIENRLFTLEGTARAAYFSDWPEEEIEALSLERLERTGHYSYEGRARVVDEAEGLVEVNGFVIELSNVLSDGYVDFEIKRLDVRA